MLCKDVYPVSSRQETMPTIYQLWRSSDSGMCREALDRYWLFVLPQNLDLERSLHKLDLERIRDLDAKRWYDFLHNEYFRWKYTAPNRYATTTRSLSEYASRRDGLDELHCIKFQLLELDASDIRAGLLIAQKIKGLGTAGASGLLALMYPTTFATVDQFVVKSLREVGEMPENALLAKMKPESLKTHYGVILIQILTRKAAENNRLFGVDLWTPRKIDQILWTYGRA